MHVFRNKSQREQQTKLLQYINQQREAGNERVISALEILTCYPFICYLHILCFYLQLYLQFIG